MGKASHLGTFPMEKRIDSHLNLQDADGIG